MFGMARMQPSGGRALIFANRSGGSQLLESFILWKLTNRYRDSEVLGWDQNWMGNGKLLKQSYTYSSSTLLESKRQLQNGHEREKIFASGQPRPRRFHRLTSVSGCKWVVQFERAFTNGGE